MAYTEIELDEEDYVLPPKRPEYHFHITEQDALAEIRQLIKIYSQFQHFPESHPSTRKLRKTAAIWQYILQRLTEKKNESD